MNRADIIDKSKVFDKKQSSSHAENVDLSRSQAFFIAGYKSALKDVCDHLGSSYPLVGILLRRWLKTIGKDEV